MTDVHETPGTETVHDVFPVAGLINETRDPCPDGSMNDASEPETVRKKDPEGEGDDQPSAVLPFLRMQSPAPPPEKETSMPSLHEDAETTVPAKVISSSISPKGEMRSADVFPAGAFIRKTTRLPSGNSCRGTLL